MQQRLLHAESLMNEHPDSALQLLRPMADEPIPDEADRAFHALLNSQALDKNYIDLTNDSIIRPAVDYYSKKDDAYHKMLAYYYWSRVQSNARQYTPSILACLEAEQEAKALGDDFYLGMIY